MTEKRIYFEKPAGIRGTNKSKEKRRIKKIEARTSERQLQQEFRWVNTECSERYLNTGC
jgi:hypothetical protein